MVPANMSERPTLVVFLGGLGDMPVEQMVAVTRLTCALDTIEAALSTGAFERTILATDQACDQDLPPGLELDIDDGPFHFGRRLAGIIRRHSLTSVVYLGGGSMPLLDGAGLSQITQGLEGDRARTNNRFSSDLVAFPITPDVLAAVEGVDRDNSLARAIEESAGLTLEELPRTVATQMDIDSPSDLAVLALTGEGGPRLRDYLRSLESETHSTGQALSLTAYQRVLPLLTDREAQIVVAGRVGSHAWQYLERETACRVRLFAEERGLESDDRASTGTARSLLGFVIEAAGIDRFFELLPQLGDAAFIDTRVLLAHMRIDATREDRFLSDLGNWTAISDPFLPDFTRLATEAAIPVLLGGHSLMSGSLMALNEFAWREHENSLPPEAAPPVRPE